MHRKKLKTITATAALLAVAGLLADQRWPLPLPAASEYQLAIKSAEGEALRVFADENGVRRDPIALDDVSPLYLEALINYEDRWFRYHPGVNPLALIRAGGQAILNGEVVSGGSTLTMQVARLIDPHRRSLPGKLKQILRALQLEWHLSKDEILSLYINQAPFGGTLEGVQTGSLAWLGKPVKQLSHAEAALLAVLPQAPSRLRPDRYPTRAQAARDKVLRRLGKFGIWSERDVVEAQQEQVWSHWQPLPQVAPLLARKLRQQIAVTDQQERQARQPTHNTAGIQTLIDRELQQQLEDWLADNIQNQPAGVSAAVVVVENDSLAVRAYLGSADFHDANRAGHVDMAEAWRSPGSTLKPFLYGMAIQDGLIHSASLLVDAPTDFNGWRPGNFARDFSGPVAADDALRESLNIPAAQLLNHLGPASFQARLANGGLRFKVPGQANLSVILGGGATTLLDLVGSYRALARGGVAGRPRLTEDESVAERRILSPAAAWVVREILNEQAQQSRRRPSHGFSDNKVAWKTGTSYGNRDAWALGVNDQYTVGIWLGRPDGRAVPGQTGSRSAVPLLFDVFAKLDQPKAPIAAITTQPRDVTQTDICWPLGRAKADTAPEHCHAAKQAWIVDRQIPPTLPDRLNSQLVANPVSVRIAKDGLGSVPTGCSIESRNKNFARWPTATLPWIATQLSAQAVIPGVHPDCSRQTNTLNTGNVAPLQITGINDHSRLLAKPGAMQLPAISLSAVGGQGQRYWLLDGQLIAKLSETDSAPWRFKRPGQYQLTAFDEFGNHDSRHIEVIGQ